MKTLALIARRSDHDRDAFRKHYEETHAPLAVATLMEGCTRYLRQHLCDDLYGAPFFDVVTSFWYRDAAAAAAIFARSQGPEGEEIRADELSFMNKAANTFFMVREQPLRGVEDASKALKLVIAARAADPVSAADFLAQYQERWLPGLEGAVKGMAWCLQNVAEAGGGSRPAFDCVTQVHADADAGVADWARELEAAGHRVLVARVSEHETTTLP